MPMRKQDRKWLEQVRLLTDSSGGMYPGMPVDRLPPSVTRRLGPYLESYSPHNPIHKERWTITQAGRDALAQQ